MTTHAAIGHRQAARPRAFTLVELLVAISVISLLAAILLPVTMRARGLARNTQCCSSLGQIGKAVDLYCEIYDTWYPCASSMPSTEPQPGLPGIADLLARYGSPDMFECPDDQPTDPEYGFRTYFKGEGTSYEWTEIVNHLKIGMPLRFGPPFTLRDMPILRDYEPFHKRGSRIGANALFVDSHVESF